MCPNLEVYTQGCSQQMDTLTLTVQPPMTSEEQVVIPPHLLRMHGITLYIREQGLVLHGLADVDVYSNVLKHVRYLYKGKADIARTITVSGFVLHTPQLQDGLEMASWCEKLDAFYFFTFS